MRIQVAVFSAAALLHCVSLGAAAPPPTVQQMLELKPSQRFVDYDSPTPDQIPHCKAEVVTEGRATGWVLRDASGRVYRRFMDTNRDNVVDQWRYYRDGIEVYRDVDSSFHGQADQFRWMNAGGTRWGYDTNQDGKIDAYRVISAEEATREFVRGLAHRDSSMIEATIVRPADAHALGLLTTADRIKEMNSRASEQLAVLTQKLTRLNANSEWVRFDAGSPQLVVGDAPDGSRDVNVYRNAVVTIQTGAHIDTLQFPEIVQVGRSWKIAEMPTVVASREPMVAQTASTGANPPAALPAIEPPDAGTPEFQAALRQLQKLDEQAAGAGQNGLTVRYHSERANLLEKLAAESKTDTERTEWQRQMADSLIAAFQSSSSPDTAARLTRLFESIKSNNVELASYIAFRQISIDYAKKIQTQSGDFTTIQKEWLGQLQRFVAEFPNTEETPEAMSQLAVGKEFSGKEAEARQYYQKLNETFPNTPNAQRAAGALKRLDAVGKPLVLSGTELRRGAMDLEKLRGRIILVDYCASTCDPWRKDLAKLKEIYAKYRAKGFEIVSVSLDNDKKDAMKLVQSESIPWPMLFEPGGLSSPLATQYGILALPTQFLVGPDGNVISRSIHVSQLEDELKKLIK